ncbi:MAG: DUF1816 domain-containing protein [Cyanobacteria bacterium P01_A01_bin.83]
MDLLRRFLPIISLFNQPQNTIKRELSWWVKIITGKPQCTYYFGPFLSKSEAIASQSGYTEDLIAEQAEEISIEITQGSPQSLTIIHE